MGKGSHADLIKHLMGHTFWRCCTLSSRTAGTAGYRWLRSLVAMACAARCHHHHWHHGFFDLKLRASTGGRHRATTQTQYIKAHYSALSSKYHIARSSIYINKLQLINHLRSVIDQSIFIMVHLISTYLWHLWLILN